MMLAVAVVATAAAKSIILMAIMIMIVTRGGFLSIMRVKRMKDYKDDDWGQTLSTETHFMFN